MNLRWLLFDFVDPQLNLTWTQRRSVRRQAVYLKAMDDHARDPAAMYNRAMPPLNRSPWQWVLHIAFFGFFIFMFRRMIWNHLPIVIGIDLAAWIIAAVLEQRQSRSLTLAALCHHGYDVCRTCGYWLRGLGNDVKQCPECGAAREPMPPSSKDITP